MYNLRHLKLEQEVVTEIVNPHPPPHKGEFISVFMDSMLDVVPQSQSLNYIVIACLINRTELCLLHRPVKRVSQTLFETRGLEVSSP